MILTCSPHVNTLVDFHFQKKLLADPGAPGRTKEQYGKNAEDLVIALPLGSIVREASTGKPLWHGYHMDDTFMICRGGQGGIGNMHFKNAITQYPQFCLLGEPGEKRDIEIELQLLADVALIGTPSVGKSSLINVIANVKAKVADYPFTTLIPNLGSVKHHGRHFNVVDVPGLIEGASQGKGLGNEFLRHIMKARVLCFMADMSRYDAGVGELAILLNELVTYLHQTVRATLDYGDLDDVRVDMDCTTAQWKLNVIGITYGIERVLFTKEILIVCNKIDEIDDEEIRREYCDALYTSLCTYIIATWGEDAFGNASPEARRALFAPSLLSALGGEGVDEWLDRIIRDYITLDSNEEMNREIIDSVAIPEEHIVTDDDESDELGDDEDMGEMMEYTGDDDDDLDDDDMDGDSTTYDGQPNVNAAVQVEEVHPDDVILDAEYTMNKQIRKVRVRKPKESVEIYETTAIDMPMLIENEFVEEADVKYAKVWFIKERELCRLVYMLPWGNDEAEMWFWNVLDKKRLLQKLITAGLVKGDIIHVHSFYEGTEDRFIRY